jgi:Tfp pilus assembly protein PilF
MAKAQATRAQSLERLSKALIMTLGAQREFEVALKQRPYDPVILNNLGWILHKSDPSRTLALLSVAAKINPRSPDVTDTLGWIKFQQKDYSGALPLLQRAHQLDKEDALKTSGSEATAETGPFKKSELRWCGGCPTARLRVVRAFKTARRHRQS